MTGCARGYCDRRLKVSINSTSYKRSDKSYKCLYGDRIRKVSINSTSYKRSDALHIEIEGRKFSDVSINSTSYKRSDVPVVDIGKATVREALFPLIPLPIKEAIY